MKPTSHDPLDDLIAAALHGKITPAERAQLDARLASEPAARAAYHEAQLMNDLLEKTHTAAQPDPGFEQRMVSGVRRKIADAQRPRESAWQSLVVLWTFLNNIFGKGSAWQYGTACVVLCVGALSVFMVTGSQVKSVFTTISAQLAMAQNRDEKQSFAADQLAEKNKNLDVPRQQEAQEARTLSGANTDTDAITGLGRTLQTDRGGLSGGSGTGGAEADGYSAEAAIAEPAPAASSPPPDAPAMVDAKRIRTMESDNFRAPAAAPAMAGNFNIASVANLQQSEKELKAKSEVLAADMPDAAAPSTTPTQDITVRAPSLATANTASAWSEDTAGKDKTTLTKNGNGAPADTDITRKLIRNAELELEVKSFQSALDQIAALTKTAGGYIDSDNSQRGGNGKLQGTVVVKVLPQNLDDFLLKLRDLGELKNQTLSTEDVTKDYIDTQARLENSRRMETQLQQLLEHTNGKVSDLLQVERELGRVRGEIEQMQGQLKLYDFQVEYATVTMQINEKDLNQAAAYLLKEQDNFTLLATDVESAFQQARHTADDFKAQVLAANLNHNSGSNVSAVLVVMVPPDQIEPFLAQVRTLGRVANFTRQSQRVARDGGDSDEPADETRTEKDKVEVQITIGSDDESRKQVALTVVTPMVDDAFDKAKTAALASTGTEILGSSLNKTPQGQSTAQMSVRVPGKDYEALLDAFRALGRTASFSLQRNDDLGPGANGDDAPVIVNLALTDDETPLQQTQLSVLAQDVDSQAQQLKQAAADAGVEIKASTFNRRPDGIETAQMVFRLPMAKYPAFIEVVKKLGKVETLTVDRNDRPDQTRTDDTAPAEIDLTMHNQGDIVADNNGLWATLRQTFGEGAGALMSSVRVIGVLVAFLVPWLIALVIVAWVGRRIYIWRKR